MENITTLPHQIKSYIDENMSSKIYSKLIRSSKRLFATYRIIVIEDLQFYIKDSEKVEGSWEYDNTNCKLTYKWKNPPIIIDLNNYKLWITRILHSFSQKPINSYSLLLKHVCRNEIVRLSLYYNQTITRFEFSMISLTLKKLRLGNVYEDNGSPVSIGDILHMTPKLEEFHLKCNPDLTPAPLFFTSRNFLKRPSLPNLKYFNAGNISECNIEEICQFIKDHFQTNFYFYFNSEKTYQAFRSLALKEFGDTRLEDTFRLLNSKEFRNVHLQNSGSLSIAGKAPPGSEDPYDVDDIY